MENKIHEKIIVSSSPHILKDEVTKNIMWLVSLCLMPAAIFGIYAFGLNAAFIIIASIVTSIITEALCLILRKKKITLDDGSAFLTGLLIGMNMPPAVPLYIPIISSIFGIAIVKHAFGGLGNNWANPAIAARVFALFAWTKQMTTWSAPFMADTVTTATPLGALKSGLMEAGVNINSTTGASVIGHLKSIFLGVEPLQVVNNVANTHLTYLDLFFGNKGGCIGEISIFLLLVGASLLVITKIVTLDIPLSYILTSSIIAFIFGGVSMGNGYFNGSISFHLFTGGLILGAFFMATDMVTTPITRKGRIIFGIGCGIITMLVRLLGGLPEGVSLSILFMNMLTPAIDRFIKVRPMGYINNNEK